MYITRTECAKNRVSNSLIATLALIMLTSLIFTLSALNGSAQTSQTTVSGTVKDQNGALVAGGHHHPRGYQDKK